MRTGPAICATARAERDTADAVRQHGRDAAVAVALTAVTADLRPGLPGEVDGAGRAVDRNRCSVLISSVASRTQITAGMIRAGRCRCCLAESTR
jgi:hypothetical protein